MLTANTIFSNEWPVVREIILNNIDYNFKYQTVFNFLSKIFCYLHQKFGESFMHDYDYLLYEYPIINNILFDSNYLNQKSPYDLTYGLELLINDLIINFIQNNPYL